MLTYNFPIVQQIVTPFGSSLSGGNYNIFNPGNSNLVVGKLLPERAEA
jgi:hypothetical protein